MATPYSTIIKRFEDKIAETDLSSLDLLTERKYLRTAISTYIGTIGIINYDNYNQQINADLSEMEITLLSLLLYDSYLTQEIIRYNKTLNISNEFVQISGVTNRVKTLKDLKEENKITINNIVTSMI